MKPMRTFCFRMSLATVIAGSLSACGSVPQVQEQINRIDIAADSYIVRAGDSLESIAFRYKLSPNELAGLNPDVGRNLVPGTPLTIRAASNVRDTYRTETAWQSQQPVSELPADSRDERVVTSPVVRSRAVPEPARTRQPTPHGEPANRSVYTPAVNAVVSDVTLLDPSRPYGQARYEDPAPSQPITGQTQAPESAATTHSAAQSLAYAGREFIEEEYTGGKALPGQQIVSGTVMPAAEGWIWPTEGQVARGFAPIQEGRHGVDIAGIPGQPVVAVEDGVVAYSGRDPSGVGNLIIVRHDDALLTAYSHAADLFVAENDTVHAGDPIATLGWNAKQESVLRFEVRRNGASVNPMDFLSIR